MGNPFHQSTMNAIIAQNERKMNLRANTELAKAAMAYGAQQPTRSVGGGGSETRRLSDAGERDDYPSHVGVEWDPKTGEQKPMYLMGDQLKVDRLNKQAEHERLYSSGRVAADKLSHEISITKKAEQEKGFDINMKGLTQKYATMIPNNEGEFVEYKDPWVLALEAEGKSIGGTEGLNYVGQKLVKREKMQAEIAAMTPPQRKARLAELRAGGAERLTKAPAATQPTNLSMTTESPQPSVESVKSQEEYSSLQDSWKKTPQKGFGELKDAAKLGISPFRAIWDIAGQADKYWLDTQRKSKERLSEAR